VQQTVLLHFFYCSFAEKYGIITPKNIKCNQNLRRKFKLQLKFGSEKADATLK
jgi:hypothetical protein